jgi:hypothetical protein
MMPQAYLQQMMPQPIMYNSLNPQTQFPMNAPTANYQGMQPNMLPSMVSNMLPNMFPNMLSNMGQPQLAQPQGVQMLGQPQVQGINQMEPPKDNPQVMPQMEPNLQG